MGRIVLRADPCDLLMLSLEESNLVPEFLNLELVLLVGLFSVLGQTLDRFLGLALALGRALNLLLFRTLLHLLQHDFNRVLRAAIFALLLLLAHLFGNQRCVFLSAVAGVIASVAKRLVGNVLGGPLTDLLLGLFWLRQLLPLLRGGFLVAA